MKEEKSLVRRIHEESWRAVTEFFQKPDVELPFLYESSRREAHQALFEHAIIPAKDRLDQKGLEESNYPVPNSMLYFIDGKICDLEIYFGGTVVPPLYMERADADSLKVSVTRENIRNFLRYGAFLYSFTALMSGHKKVGKDLVQFEDIVSTALTLRVLDDTETEFVARVYLEDQRYIQNYKKAVEQGTIDYDRVFTASPPTDNEVMQFSEVVKLLKGMTEKHHPITEWDKLILLLPVFRDETIKNGIITAYNELASKNILFHKRNINGRWEIVEPIRTLFDMHTIYVP